MKNLLTKYYTHMGLNALVESKFEKAYKYFKKILKLNPDKKGVNLNIATALLGLRKYEEAERHYLEELAKFGGNYYIFKSLAELYYIWGKREKATQFFEKALTKCAFENEEKFIKKRIKLLKDEDKYNKMLKGYDLFIKGNELMDKKEYDDALKLFLESIKYDAINPFAYNNIATIYMNHKKDYKNALIYFEKALKIFEQPVIKKNYLKLKTYLQSKNNS